MESNTTKQKRKITPQAMPSPEQSTQGTGPDVTSTTAATGILHPALQMVLIVIVGSIIYSNSFTAGFEFDCVSSITDNPVIKNLETFVSGAGYAYNPRRFIGFLSFALNYHFGGLNLFGYHLVNLIIHLITALLVFSLARITFRTSFFTDNEGETMAGTAYTLATYIPLFSALLFVLHPVQTQAVTYIVQRFTSLAALFYLASVLAYTKARLDMVRTGAVTGRAIGWLVLALVSALLAMRTKETTVTLPLAILFYEFSFFGASNRKKRFLLLAPLMVTIFIIPVGAALSGKPVGQLLSDVSAMTKETVDISRSDYLLTQFSVIVTYLRLLFFPVNQNLDYDYPLYHSLLVPRVFFSFLLLTALAGLTLWLYRISRTRGNNGVVKEVPPFTQKLYRLIGFGIGWFFLTLLVESSIIPIRDVIYEHRLYLPVAGFFISIAAGCVVATRYIPLRAMVTGCVTICLVLAVITWNRNQVWRTSVSIWSDTVAKSPNKNRPHYNLAQAYRDENRFAEAEQEYQRALTIDSSDIAAINNLGIVYAKAGRFNETLAVYNRALQINPNHYLVWFNIGSVYAMHDQFVEAERNLLQSIKIKADYAPSRYSLGLLYQKFDRLPEAERETRETLKLDPRHHEALNNLGIVYMKRNRPADAEPYFAKALALKPDNYGYQTNLSKARLQAQSMPSP